ncbi:AAA family ATPase [Sphingomonas sp. AR_OL41]|uniref:AAA family ATPase n=1 Tax=Sphingomonas sp. AR_OL41 TaxID=3042729 RepID=UPI0024810616|nr:AAA family ATPase [Sphingomonas sp. AR_OL41]MDH7974743.1 AAA family ATPase [Sphingomonas sp. AR_OL41]
MTRGFVLGKFMPPHGGHQLLCETARALVDELTILVCWLPDDPIPGALRLGWMRELFPDCRVLGHDAVVPQQPEEHPDFWSIWHDIIVAAHPEPVDIVFASEPYGARLAYDLGARFVPVDPDRDGAAVSGSAVRADPWQHWDHLPPPVRGHYARTICLHGPESTGKSTLARQLAQHFATAFVPEYGRTWCATFGNDLVRDDLRLIARAQDAMANSLRRRCNRRLILDTDPLMTAAWSEMMLGAHDPWFDRWDEPADLYLLLDIDLPWVDDGTRLFGAPADRRRFFDLCVRQLDRRGVRWAMVSGIGDARRDHALEAISHAGL